MGYPVSVANSTTSLQFLMVLSSDHITGATGKTVTVTLKKNGGTSFAAAAGTVTEVGSGWYSLSASAVDANTLGPMLLHATASGCDPRDDTFVVVNYNPSSVDPISPPTTSTFGTITALQILTTAYQLIGVKSPGEDVSGYLASDGLKALNRMVSAWATMRLTIPAQASTVYTYPADTTSVTIGNGGDWDQVRPLWLSAANYLIPGTTPANEVPLGILDDDAWMALPIKGLTSALPTDIYYNKTFTLGTIYLWPVPTQDVEIRIQTPTALTGFAALTTQYAFPPGYEEAIIYNLARRLAIPNGRQVEQDVKDIAASGLRLIKSANVQIPLRAVDTMLQPTTGGRYNVRSDQGA